MISKLMKKMIDYSEGSLHDVNHFIKVYTFAKTIGELENLDRNTQMILEAAAILHDIACPMLRAKYGEANGKLQEIEGMPLAKELLNDSGLTPEQRERVVYLVGHHHTIEGIDGIDYQILLEADYLVNADESNYAPENIQKAYYELFRTKAGKQLLNSIYMKTI